MNPLETVNHDQSPSLASFAPAFLAAQKVMGSAIKGAANEFFKSNYADLEEVINAIRVPLNDNGITFSQQITDSQAPHWVIPRGLTDLISEVYPTMTEKDQGDCLDGLFATRPKQRVAVRTVLLHESGEYMATTASFPAIKEDPQMYMSSSTYLCRGLLRAITGLPTEDDDGEKASGRGKDAKDRTRATVKVAPPSPTSKAQAATPVQQAGVAKTEIHADPQATQAKSKPLDGSAFNEMVDKLSSQYDRGTIKAIKIKESVNGEYASLLVVPPEGRGFYANCFGTPGHFGLTEWNELQGQEIFFKVEVDEKNGRKFTRIVELFPADVFDAAMTEWAERELDRIATAQ